MIRLFFFKNYFSDNWNKIDFVIVVGSVIDVVLDLLKVFHFSCVFFRFNVIFCLPSSLQQHCFRFKASTFERLEQKKNNKKLFFSCDVLFIFLSALLSHVSALLIGVLDSGHQLSSVPSGSNSKNLKEVYLFEISFVELLSINEGTIIVIKSSFTTFLDNILLFIYPRNVCKSILFN